MSFRKVTYSRRPSHAARAAHARGAREFRTYDTSAIRPRRSRAPFIALAAVVLVVVIALVAVFATNACSPTNDHMVAEGEQVTVEIPEGSTLSDVSEILFDKGLIYRTADFESAVNAKGAATSLHSGVYSLTGGMSNDDIVDALTSGSTAVASLSVPEGATVETIAGIVEQAYGGSITADDFKKAAVASDYVKDFPFLSDAADDSLEGFLFPKTYDLLVGANASDVVRQMLTQYQTETASLSYSHGLSAYETLILASIVEKEGTADTYAKVAAVFYNRLNTKGDPSYGTLGSDATTVYEIGDNLDSYDWSTKSPYNTRVTKGLPPTPICSPSLQALQAVCSPEPNFDDYYFFSFWPNEQGGVDYFFDKTYDDHQKTIADHS